MSRSAPPQSLARIHAELARREVTGLAEIQAYLRIPGFSDTGEGIRESAEATLALLRRVSPDARLVATAGHPVVLGHTYSHRRPARTLLIYGLYDVTPLIAEEWSVDPLAAAVVDAPIANLPARLGRILVGRGANNHRGPVLATIQAVEAILAIEGDVPCNLVWLIEGEEEIGSPNLAEFVDEQRAEIGAVDGAWLPCMAQNSGGTMVLRRAYKGSLQLELACEGGKWGGPRDGRHLWAGHAPWLDAPLMVLVQAVASLFDPDHRVAIDGLADASVPPVQPDSPEVLGIERWFRENPWAEERIKEVLHVAQFRGGRPLADHVVRYMLDTTINVQGFVGGYQGPSYYTMLPGRAAARIDIRFPPSVQPEHVENLLRAHLDRRGFAEVQIRHSRGYAGSAPLDDADDTLRLAAMRAAARHGVRTEVWPIANNCCPAALFQSLGRAVPFSVAGLGHGDRPHAPDEFIKADAPGLLRAFATTYLHEWAETPVKASLS